MIIHKLKINAYGKLKDREIELDDHINVVHGENEAGKSTILNFITNMLYGISKIKMEKNIQILRNINHGITKIFQEK